MKTVTIRDLRQRWPETEKALHLERELIITRDGKPVARLVRVVANKSAKKNWSPDAHKQWLRKVWGDKVFSSADAQIASDRADRWEKESA